MSDGQYSVGPSTVWGRTHPAACLSATAGGFDPASAAGLPARCASFSMASAERGGESVQISHEGAGPEPVSDRGPHRRAWLPDLAGVAWVIVASIAVVVPALHHGLHLGPYDVLSKYGITQTRGASVHNPALSDQIALFIPWTNQAWTLVHQGHLPLWNQYSGLGLPLAFNWQSAPFGLPALVGYLFPLQYAYTVGIIVTSVIAGTGAYVFARMIRLGVIASALAGSVFILSGPMASILGWPAISVGSWTGWLFAAALMVIRGRNRVRAVAAFALILAMAIYSGYPELLFLLLVSLLIFVLAALLGDATMRHWRPTLRTLMDLSIASVAGVALAGPLVLPGLQLANESSRLTANIGTFGSVNASTYFGHFLFQGFDGLPISGSGYFGPIVYQATASYFGVIAVVLCALAIGTRWKRPEVIGLCGICIVISVLCFVPGVVASVKGVPLVGSIQLATAGVPLAFGLACLAGVGLDAFVRNFRSSRVLRWAGGGFAVAALVLIGFWILGRGHLPPAQARSRGGELRLAGSGYGSGWRRCRMGGHQRPPESREPATSLYRCHHTPRRRDCLPSRCGCTVVVVESQGPHANAHRVGVPTSSWVLRRWVWHRLVHRIHDLRHARTRHHSRHQRCLPDP